MEPSSSEPLPNTDEKGSGEHTHGANEVVVYPTGIVLAAIVVALCLAIFLVALDQTIIATAIPRITDRFQSVKDIGWYGAVRPQSYHFYHGTYIRLGLFLDVYFSAT